MKDFIVDYLKDIIPVCFNLKRKDQNTIVGIGEPEFTVTLNKEIRKSDLLKSTSLALGEAYMNGDIQIDKDIYEVLDKFMGNMDKFKTNRLKLGRLFLNSVSRQYQKKEVSSHYDIGNDFYKLWLDETLSYSCAYFKSKDDSLYEAQVNKVDHILEKLHLEESMTLLDIGCGWGFLLIQAAKKYKIKGVGITLSIEQYNKFRDLIKEENLEDYLQVKLMDYRDLKISGFKFDRVVSVGMIEHVGRKNYDLFMENVDSVLKPQGLFLLHYISALRENKGDPWIRKYIFPGGVIPSLREIIDLLPNYNFYTLDIESLRRHYNKTLLLWRENFINNKEKIIDMMGIEFTRMWELYLASCAASFNNGIVDVHQILISKGINNNLPMNRIV